MSKTLINFVHANGFPAGSYKTFFNCFGDNINIIALEKFGHNSHFPSSSNWQYLVAELIAFVENKKTEAEKDPHYSEFEKAVCVGHSFGGVISFIATCQRPDLFKGLIMLDPPVVTGLTALSFKLLKKTKWFDKLSPAGKAAKRRTYWPLGSDIARQFSKRKLFKQFDPRCLHDYVNSVIAEKEGKLALTFSADIEANIFRNIPANLPTFKNKLTIPATLLYGEKTDIFPIKFFHRFAKLNRNIQLKTINGGHMFPLEQPEKTAMMIEKIIDSWQ